MKIGVLTFHGAHNYGSVLQAYATCRLLSKWGHDVQIINLRNQAQKDAYRILDYDGRLIIAQPISSEARSIEKVEKAVKEAGFINVQVTKDAIGKYYYMIANK